MSQNLGLPKLQTENPTNQMLIPKISGPLGLAPARLSSAQAAQAAPNGTVFGGRAADAAWPRLRLGAFALPQIKRSQMLPGPQEGGKSG